VGVVHDMKDVLHERRIKVLSERCSAAFRAGAADDVRRAWDELKAAIDARSPAQIERMERANLEQILKQG